MLRERDKDYFYMRRALALAARARGRTSPNPMVGAVIVSQERIVGEGYHQRAGTPHAEVHALRQAGEKARGATLYVNLEPCCHFGRTPPCCEQIIAAGIRRVVAAMEDPNPQVAGKGIKRLREAGVEVECGVLEEEARRLNEAFFKFITAGRPFVVLKAAVSLDGKIATASGESMWITGEAARTEAHRLRNTYDAVMVGIGTVLKDNPQLTTRLPAGEEGRDAVRVVVDSRLRLPLNARVINPASPAPLLVATTEQAPRERLELLERQEGVEVLCFSSRDGQVPLGELMEELGKREICSVLLEGGATLNASALKEGIVDKVVVFMAPRIIGGTEAPGMVGGSGCARLSDAWKLEEVSFSPVGEDIMLVGYLAKKASGRKGGGLCSRAL